MNLNTENLTIKPCLVCDYIFADRHHIWPQAKGGGKLPTVDLCPNHHRYANIVQAMLLQQRPRAEIEQFAAQHFDRAFNTIMLSFLINEQERISWRGWAFYYEGQLREAIARNDQIGVIRAALRLASAAAGDRLEDLAEQLGDAEYEALAAYRRDRSVVEESEVGT